jgi:phosphopantothenoylcysteine decarboxylase/phosphopantothenate--cysteine ligase
MRFLVSAGPTREMIDEVRYLSNLSSGRTGYAVAEAARDAGHEVILVSGPVDLSPPPGITLVKVTSAVEMHAAILAAYPRIDAVVMTAAVADYRPASRVTGKLKKGSGPMTLELVRNPDILEELGRGKTRQVLIGFALEVQDAEGGARAKLERKNLDLVVLNGPENFAGASSRFRLLDREGHLEDALELTKEGLGALLVRRAEELFAAS